MFKIEKGVSEQGALRESHDVYPFKTMEVGDSFFIPQDRVDSFRNQASFKSQIYSSAYKAGMKAKIRSFPDGMRVWRTA